MRPALGETFRTLHLTGTVAARSATSALVQFEQIGFLAVMTDCEGEYQTVITVSLPDWMLNQDALAEIERSVIAFFELPPADQCLLNTCQPLTRTNQGGLTRPYVAELVSPDGRRGEGGRAAGSAKPPYGLAQYLVDALEKAPRQEVYSVPRRYDLASMFSISVAFAVLFAIMKAMDAPPSTIMLAGFFFTVVGVAQALLFGGEKPREASILAGLAAGPCSVIVYALVEGVRPSTAIASSMCAIVWAPVAGYLAGTTIGGIWLIADYLRKWLEGRRSGSLDDGSP